MVEIIVFFFRLFTLKCRASFSQHKRRKSSQFAVNTVKDSYVGKMKSDRRKSSHDSGTQESPTKKSTATIPDIKLIVNGQEFQDDDETTYGSTTGCLKIIRHNFHNLCKF